LWGAVNNCLLLIVKENISHKAAFIFFIARSKHDEKSSIRTNHRGDGCRSGVRRERREPLFGDNALCKGSNGTITGYTGSAKVIEIPAIIDGLPITAIGRSALDGNQFTSVTIPDSVTSIGDYAFSYNPLTSVTIGNSVAEIGMSAFRSSQLTSVTIPDSVTSIGNDAFSLNPLAGVTIGAGVNLQSYSFPGNLPQVYTSGGSQAGTYISGGGGSTWAKIVVMTRW
jgi:hypothetical protein